ncbi:MAG: restriction endonuclease subunit S [Gammaproteobacteria bacterium]|nr:restriction endonuclease subunit S [Gammaproteobacteria bacterium]
MSFPGYAEYSESNYAFIGHKPRMWIEGRLKNGVERFISGGTPDSNNPEYWDHNAGIGWVSIADMSRDYLITSTNKRLSKLGLMAKKLDVLPKGSLLYSIYATLGSVAELQIEAATNQAILGLVPNISVVSPRFLRWWLVSLEHYVKRVASSNTQDNLNSEKVRNLPLLVPSSHEQTQIARFLDHETAKIDALIAEQKRLIKLLQEKRQAVTSHAVTKGLDPNVPMKDSGVEWLGEVPAHWGLSKLKFLIERLIDTEHKTVPFDDDGDFYVARTSDIRNGKLDLNHARRTDSEGYTEWTKRGPPRKGDIIFTREAPAGEACIVPVDDKICLGQRTVLIKLNEDLLISGFTLWSIYGGLASRFIKELSQGSTVSHINMSDIPNTPILLPPLNEQVDIDRYLMSMTGKYDLLMIESERLMLRLTERRSTLISAAVTGKIDVRDWQPPADESAFDEDVQKAGMEASA